MRTVSVITDSARSPTDIVGFRADPMIWCPVREVGAKWADEFGAEPCGDGDTSEDIAISRDPR
jgi:hypothetical protein